MYIPLFIVGLSMVFTLMIIELLNVKFAYILGFLALALAMVFRKQKTFLLAFLSVFFACFLFVVKTEFYLNPALEFVGEKVEITGQVVELEGQSDTGANRYIVKVSSGELKGYKIRLSSKYCECNLNDYVSFSGKPYDMTKWMKSKEVFLGVYVFDDITVTPCDNLSKIALFRQKMSKVRGYLENVLYENLSSDYALVLLGMLVGEKSNFPDDIYENFKTSGVVHLLAVSGFHTSLWSMIVYRQLQKRGVNLKVAASESIVFVLLFLGLTGFQKSATRASLMLIIFFFGRVLTRQPDSKNSLGIAAIIIVALNPFVGGDIGFLLSFFSTLGILTVYPMLMKGIRPKVKLLVPNFYVRQRAESLISTVLITISTQVFTLPLIMIYIGDLSIVSPLTNLLITVFASTAIFVTGVAVILAKIPVLCAFSKALFLAAGLLCRYILWVTKSIASFEFASVDISVPYMYVTVAAVLILMGVSVMIKANKRRTIAYSCLIFFVSIATHYLVEYVELHNFI